MSDRLAVDTSVAVPLIVAAHEHHVAANQAIGKRQLVLAGHAAIETYSVITRLPVFERVSADDAMALLDDRFANPIVPTRSVTDLLRQCAQLGIVGGAVYDALVAAAAIDNGLRLLTRDERALPTYAALGATIELVGT